MTKRTVPSVILMMLLVLSLSACGASGNQKSTSYTGTSASTEDNREDDGGEQLIGAFQTTDLEGNEVTEAVFAQADVTFVNVWGTFCPPCIGEMPELEEIHKDLPDRFQMIGVLCDVSGENSAQYPTALEIVEKTGVTYPSLIGSESMEDFLGTISAVPVSFFVDSDGCVIGDPVIGADIETYKARIEELKAIYGAAGPE